ncbi:MAG: hypothetical protein MHPSP_004082 [Paramarteilia canceri]
MVRPSKSSYNQGGQQVTSAPELAAPVSRKGKKTSGTTPMEIRRGKQAYNVSIVDTIYEPCVVAFLIPNHLSEEYANNMPDTPPLSDILEPSFSIFNASNSTIMAKMDLSDIELPHSNFIPAEKSPHIYEQTAKKDLGDILSFSFLDKPSHCSLGNVHHLNFNSYSRIKLMAPHPANDNSSDQPGLTSSRPTDDYSYPAANNNNILKKIFLGVQSMLLCFSSDKR